jgi:hypothetical protein
MGPARIYPWRKTHRCRVPSIAPGTFFVAQPWADCTTNMPGFNLRHAQPEAPVGHRQPRADQVPPEKNLMDPNDPINRENAALDRMVKGICRGC